MQHCVLAMPCVDYAFSPSPGGSPLAAQRHRCQWYRPALQHRAGAGQGGAADEQAAAPKRCDTRACSAARCQRPAPVASSCDVFLAPQCLVPVCCGLPLCCTAMASMSSHLGGPRVHWACCAVCLYLGACLEPPCLVLEYCAKKSLFALLSAGRSDPRVSCLSLPTV